MLCRRLAAEPIAKRLPEPGGALLEWARYVDRALVRARRTSGAEVVKVAQDLSGRFDQAPRTIRAVLLRELPGLLVRVPPDQLDTVLGSCPEPVFDAYMAEIRPQLERANADPMVAARLFLVMLQLEGSGHPYGAAVGRQLLATLRQWKKRDLELLQQALERVDPAAVPHFDAWREQHHKSFQGRIGQLLQRRQRPDPAD
jgi:hypothetical protein